MASKKENFKVMKDGELEKKLAALREDLRTIHFKAEGSKSKNVKESQFLRRNIARVLTELRSRSNK